MDISKYFNIISFKDPNLISMESTTFYGNSIEIVVIKLFHFLLVDVYKGFWESCNKIH